MSGDIQEAITYHRQGDFNKAHAIYTQLLESDLHNSDVIHLIGLLAIEIGSHTDAINLILQAIEHDESQPDYYFSLAYAMHKVGWEEQTITAYQKCVINRPKYAEAFNNLGWVYTQFNQYEEAIRAYKHAMLINPKLFAAYIGLSITLKRMGLSNEAKETFQIAVQLVPSLAPNGMEPLEALQKLEEQDPFVYKPRVVAPTIEPQESDRVMPPSGVVKPTIRLIHQLPVSGGSLICRCLGSMDGITLFNNINPRSSAVPEYPVNIFAQANNWYRLFTPEDIQKLEGTNLTFVDAIEMIHERVEDRDELMVLRDWTHLDYISYPFFQDSPKQLTLAQMLATKFEVLNVCTTLHPFSNWLNLERLNIMDGYDMDTYINAYHEFAKAAKDTGFIRSEDFRINPGEELEKLCDILDIPFDPGFEQRWKFYSRIDAEFSDPTEDIVPHPPIIDEYDLLSDFEANFNYWPALEALGYEHPEA